MLRDAGETTVVIDEQPSRGRRGRQRARAGDPGQARVIQARTVVLALSNDSAGVFATAVIRDYAPRIRLVARSTGPQRGTALPGRRGFRAVDGQVAGQLLAYHLLGRAPVSGAAPELHPGDPGRLVGTHPWKAGVRERSGAAVWRSSVPARCSSSFGGLSPARRRHRGDLRSGASLDQFMLAFQAARRPAHRPAESSSRRTGPKLRRCTALGPRRASASSAAGRVAFCDGKAVAGQSASSASISASRATLPGSTPPDRRHRRIAPDHRLAVARQLGAAIAVYQGPRRMDGQAAKARRMASRVAPRML